ncbi:MAG: MEDS domain-containing protein [Sedimentisphaerales bacterium]
MTEIEKSVRKSGIDVLGSVPWGTHACLFYKTKQDLISVLVPYFKAGLENNEFCMWVTSEPLSPMEAEKAMSKAAPNFDNYLKKGQIEIVAYTNWYLKGGTFDQECLLQAWMDKLNQALTDGYAGMRVTGNTTWLDKRIWKNFIDYEKELNEKIDKYHMISICIYCLNKCGSSEIIDVVNTHQLALIGERKEYRLVKNAERKRAEQRAREYQAQLKSLASELTLTEEREKHRIATELHDRISQSLVISKIKLEALLHSVHSGDPAKVLEEVCNSLGKAIMDTRSLTSDLSYPILHELGFETAVAEWLNEQVGKKHGIETEFEDDEQPKPLDDDIRVLLFRSVQELLVNVVQHAHAHKVNLSIARVGSQICVMVKDDGVGFNTSEVAEAAAKKGKFGLLSVRERLEQLGGHLEIETQPGQGCKVTMVAPLKHSENI